MSTGPDQITPAMLQAYNESKASAPYGFLRQRPSFGTAGYEPSGKKGEPGKFTEPLLRVEFGDFDIEDTGDADIPVLRMLHAQAEATFRSTIDTIEAIQQDDDPTLNNDGRLKALGKVVEPKIASLATMAEREIAKAATNADDLRRQIEKQAKVADPLDIGTHDSIRRFWLEKVDIAGKVTGTSFGLAELDLQTVQALGTAPHYLSGLTAEQHARVREELARRVAPDLVQREAAIRTGILKAANALQVLDRKVNKLVDLKRARQLSDRARTHE